MTVTTHQPIFLPWPGFFYKALRADVLVLLDRVQFPQGRSWMSRNRLKSDQGEHWLTVPVWKRGRGKQMIADVEICDDTNWRQRHLRGVRHLYAQAPYLTTYLPALERIYARRHRRLLAFNLDLIRYQWECLVSPGRLLLQSELGVAGSGTELLVGICRALEADAYVTFSAAEKYLDERKLLANGIELVLTRFRAPVYPQLWGEFRHNLSTLDLLLTCGPKAHDIIAHAG